jgi:DNA helicase-2/ATP-dependent DNA helicase PcrA
MSISYLEKLNPQQRRAVEHGGSSLHEARALLIIAGAGSGKTNTLAHRVAHLIVNGADPRRIMLLTFTRRAAAEMTRRVERIVANVMRGRTAALTDAISWAGTFHAVGASVPPTTAASLKWS